MLSKLIDVVEQMFVNEIKGIIWTRQTHLQSKEYLVKHKGYHPKEVVWVKPSQLDHLLNMVAKFEQERGHELGMKMTRKKKALGRNNPTPNHLKC